jgi:acyl transferase domain-containing protein
MEEVATAYTSAQPLLFLPAGSSLVGVYVGCMYHEYLDAMVGAGMKLAPQAFVGNGAPYMVGRLSYSFGFTGN